MNKYGIVIVGLLFLWAPEADGAQAAWLRTLTKRAATHQAAAQTPREVFRSSPTALSRTLDKRILKSYEQNRALWQTLDNEEKRSFAHGTNHAATAVKGKFPSKFTTQLYPEMGPLLRSGKLTSRYFVSRNNRSSLYATKVRYQNTHNLKEHINELATRKKNIYHAPYQDMHWLARQIPQNTSYFLIGEFHDKFGILQSMTELLGEVRQAFPGRQIFLFTEFLPEGVQLNPRETSWYNPASHSAYDKIWNTALQADIRVIGLEPVFVDAINAELIQESCGTDIWCSVEGIRQRNQRWFNTLLDYRQQYPQALFIVYSGSGHVRYNEPYSLGLNLSREGETFLATLVPGFYWNTLSEERKSLLRYEPWFENWKKNLSPQNTDFMPYSWFDFASEGKFPDRVLQFAREDRLTTGFDIQIKVQ